MMAWGLFGLLLVASLIVQTAVVPFVHPRMVDLLLVVALVCGLTVPAPEARLAGWLTGLAQDIGGAGPLGLHAVVLGLAVLGLTHLRELVNLHVWWGRWVAALMVAVPAQVLILLHLRFWQGASVVWGQSLAEAWWTALLAALLAALFPLALGLFGRHGRRRPAAPRW